MRALVQRVRHASVSVQGEEIASIGSGMCVLVGVGCEDTAEDAASLASKLAKLRIFEDEEGRITHSLLDIGGEALVVSQFTLYADCAKGRRPSFAGAAPAEQGRRLYEELVRRLESLGATVKTGLFQARMEVRITNDGPFTLLLDTDREGQWK